MVRSVENGLKRLRADRIDIYKPHSDDGITLVEETARGFDDLVRAGKIVYTGFSNFPAWRVALPRPSPTWAARCQFQCSRLSTASSSARPSRSCCQWGSPGSRGDVGHPPLARRTLTGKCRNGEPGREGSSSRRTPRARPSSTRCWPSHGRPAAPRAPPLLPGSCRRGWSRSSGHRYRPRRSTTSRRPRSS